MQEILNVKKQQYKKLYIISKYKTKNKVNIKMT